MTIDRLRELYNARPFRRFVISLGDGRKVPVYKRDWMLLAPSGRTIVVVQPDDSVSMINVDESAQISETGADDVVFGGSGHYRPPSKTVLVTAVALVALAFAFMLLLLLTT